MRRIQWQTRGRARDLGDGFVVNRVLPSSQRRMIGPFVFMDHLGPLALEADQAVDVRPHPHVGLATVTYLWQGRIEHKDGLGNHQVIEPGAVNWMTAGNGIVHSERTAAADRGHRQTMHGLQLWVALPRDREEGAPAFEHTAADALPGFDFAGVTGRVVAGHAYGLTSPVSVSSDLFYVDATIPAGKTLVLPNEHEQRAAYVIDGLLRHEDEALPTGALVAFEARQDVVLEADVDTHLVLLGGAPLDGPRYIWWNFVASSQELLDVAKAAWREQRYTMVPGDAEFIPLPVDQRATVKLDPH